MGKKNLRCTVEWSSYWWHLRLVMLNYTHECLDDMSSMALFSVPFRQTAGHRSWIKITTFNVSNVGQDWFPGCWIALHYIAVFDKAGKLDLQKAPIWSMPTGGAAAFLIVLQRERQMENMRMGCPLQQVAASLYVKWQFHSKGQYVITVLASLFPQHIK